jgi:hypothetical protein
VGKRGSSKGFLAKRPSPSSNRNRGGVDRTVGPAGVGDCRRPGVGGGRRQGENREEDAGYLSWLSPRSGTPCGGGSAARDGRRRRKWRRRWSKGVLWGINGGLRDGKVAWVLFIGGLRWFGGEISAVGSPAVLGRVLDARPDSRP